MNSHRASGRAAIAGFLLAFIAALTSCSGPQTLILNRPVTATKTTFALINSAALADGTIQTLRDEDLLNTYRRGQEEAIIELARRFEKNPTAARRTALAEMASDTGDRLTKSDPKTALAYYLDVARLCENASITGAGTNTESVERTLYNYSAARVARVIHAQNYQDAAPLTVTSSLRSYQLGVAKGRTKVAPSSFDLIVPASWVETKGLDIEHIAQNGFGAAMIGYRKGSEDRRAEDPMMPMAGYGIPVNASLRFSGSRATLMLEDLMLVSEAKLDGKPLPLAADYTAALGFLYYQGRRKVNKVMATLRPAKYRDTIGMYSLEPFREDKIPLVLVHGLLSTANGWMPFANLLRADPVLREKYQLIFFNYPTGSPIGSSSAELREGLAKFQRDFDPNQSNLNMRNMVILGHSMGGIISNWQIRDSGRQLERLVFKDSIDEVNLDPQVKAQIERSLIFKSNPDIQRAIFIAAPHRGSAFATNPIGILGAWLIRLPFGVVDAALGNINVVNTLTTAAQSASERPSNSASSLRPDNPLLPAILKLPVRKGLPIHSIIAQKKESDPKLEGGDGVVPYTSAHLDGVKSEIVVVDATHRSVLTKDETIQEVRRILHLHAGSRGAR